MLHNLRDKTVLNMTFTNLRNHLEAKIDSVLSLFLYILLGLEAFKSHIKVARTPDLVDEKENMQRSETFDTHPLSNLNGEKLLADTSVSSRNDQADIENAGEDLDQLSYDDIYRLEAELSARQRDSSEIGIPGPELDDEYDNEISEEKPIVIDRSFSALQGRYLRKQNKMSRLMTKPTKLLCAQRRLRSARANPG